MLETERENTVYYSGRIGRGANPESIQSHNCEFSCTSAPMLHCSAQRSQGGINGFSFHLALARRPTDTAMECDLMRLGAFLLLAFQLAAFGAAPRSLSSYHIVPTLP